MSPTVAQGTAQVMVQAMKEFSADGCGSLKDVRIIIFQQEMIKTFESAVEQIQGLKCKWDIGKCHHIA